LLKIKLWQKKCYNLYMFSMFKHLFYLVLVLAAIFLYWFLPKYSFVAKNPGYCVNLTKNIYYCGNQAGLDKLFNISK
jgi:hypothetical protein